MLTEGRWAKVFMVRVFGLVDVGSKIGGNARFRVPQYNVEWRSLADNTLSCHINAKDLDEL